MNKGASVLVRRSTHPPAQKTRAATEAGTEKGRFYRPKAFRHDGFDYRQISRKGSAAIYEQTWNGCDNPSPCWEVIRIRRRDAFRIGGRFVEPAEVYPKSEAWGVNGFTFTVRNAAFATLGQIEAK